MDPVASAAPAALENVPLSLIRTNPAALRTVDHEGVEFQEILESVRAHGVLQTVTLRRSTPEETAKDAKKYVLIDGLQRFTASMETGKETIPAVIKDIDEASAMAMQLMSNAIRVDTKPIEFMKHIIRYLGFFPTMTEGELATKMGKSPTWIGKIMNLNKLNENIKPIVNEGKMSVNNAHMLSKLPADQQQDWLTRAQTMDALSFAPLINARIKEIREANRMGKDPSEEKFTPVALVRSKKDLEAELTTPQVGTLLVKADKVAEGAKDKDDAATKGFKLGVLWALNLDSKSLEVQRAKYEEAKKAKTDAAAKRAQEKKDKEEKEAKERTEIAAKQASQSKAPVATAAKATAPKGAPVAAGV